MGKRASVLVTVRTVEAIITHVMIIGLVESVARPFQRLCSNLRLCFGGQEIGIGVRIGDGNCVKQCPSVGSPGAVFMSAG